ncbi:MAG: response regulator transcription factor [Flavitalea sp.]
MNILVVEDELKVAAFLKKGLEEQQHNVTVFHDGIDGLNAATENEYDCLILDVLLPGINGREICKRLRKKQIDTPILMLTALQTMDDIVTGFETGADDYLTKPFHFRELIARVNAITRRHRPNQVADEVLKFDDLELNTAKRTATRQSLEIILTAREYALLELFMRNPNKVLSRIFISDAVWGIDYHSGTNVVDVYVNYIRNKIEKPFNGSKLIHTLTGMGYILKSE